MKRKRKQGGPTSTVDYSPDKLKRMRAGMKRREAHWASLAGPVTVTRIEAPGPEEEQK